MKKLLFIGLIVSVCFNLYLVNVEYVVVDDFNDDSLGQDKDISSSIIDDQVKLAQSSIQKPLKDQCSCKEMTKEEVAEKKSQLSDDEMKEQITAKNREWLEKSENFFIDELDLDSEQISRYRELGVLRQKEISDYFEKKMAKINGDNGDTNETYFFTTDDTIFMGTIAQNYEIILKGLFGEESYQRHKAFIKNHNKKVETDEFVQLIEF